MTLEFDQRGAILRAAHASWSNGDIEGILQRCTHDVTYRCNLRTARGAPLEIRGKRAFRALLTALAARVESVSVAEFVQSANGVGSSRIDWYIQHRKSSLVLSSSSRQIVRFRGERICDVEDYHDAPKLAAFWRLAETPQAAPNLAAVLSQWIDMTGLRRLSSGPYGLSSRDVTGGGDQQMAMHFSEHERVAVFIDGANLYAATKALGFDIDYKRLLEAFRGRGHLVRALYYTAVPEDQEYSSIRPLVDWLDYNGFTIVTKPAKEVSEASGRRKLRGDMDVELSVDAMRLAASLDHIVLISGDGDFRYLVEALQQMGKRVSVVSSLHTQPPMVADELRRQADQFIDLYDLRPSIGRKDAPARASPARS